MRRNHGRDRKAICPSCGREMTLRAKLCCYCTTIPTDPTPEDIAAKAEAIRASWPRVEAAKRIVGGVRHATVPEYGDAQRRYARANHMNYSEGSRAD